MNFTYWIIQRILVALSPSLFSFSLLSRLFLFLFLFFSWEGGVYHLPIIPHTPLWIRLWLFMFVNLLSSWIRLKLCSLLSNYSTNSSYLSYIVFFHYQQNQFKNGFTILEWVTYYALTDQYESNALMLIMCELTGFMVSFIGGGNRSTRRKPPTCRKSLTNLIT